MSDIKAVLGPTNTGKTHFAIERMLAHGSGMIGLPLRLLAREVYDKICALKGVGAAALITGEERIWPSSARYFACTVESMPAHVPVDCLAIDEIQLAEDPDRGHIFTDRLLRARGTSETLFLGAETMRPVLAALDLPYENDPRHRFSDLQYAGPIKITKLPKRSAIIAFNSEQVYAIGELLKRQKGGAAIIMGALSPRTRNAQVELYQSGEVDYVVATDAIGMGLNLDVDHIAFAALTKFDGHRRRHLRPAEVGQIAGRAGRFRQDGTFGETADCPLFGDQLVGQVTHHTFEPVERIEWRNTDLDYSSIQSLLSGLARPSGHIVLKQNPKALDEWTARRLAADPEVQSLTVGERWTRRLWDLCRLPDFRKAGHDGHLRIVQGLFEHLADPDARLSDDAMGNRFQRLDTIAGDIPALQERLAAIRTWAYAAHRDDWLENPETWREKARTLEDQLSDELHDALTARFVDRRTTALLASLQKKDAPAGELSGDGEIVIEGHRVGRLVGLQFVPDTAGKSLEGKAIRNAAYAALKPILMARLAQISAAGPADITLNPDNTLSWGGDVIGRLKKGSSWLKPQTELVGADQLALEARTPAREKLDAWVSTHVATTLPGLTRLADSSVTSALSADLRGLAFRLAERGAAIDLREDTDRARLDAEARDALKSLGARAGRVSAHIPDAQKPKPQRLIAQLRTLYDGELCPVAPEGAGSFPISDDWTDAHLAANGYLRLGRRAVRADLAERLAWEVSSRRKEAAKTVFAIPPELASIVSCPGDAFAHVLKGLGIVPAEKDPETGVPTLWRYSRRGGGPSQPGHDRRKTPAKSEASGSKPEPKKKSPRRSRPHPRTHTPNPDSPFAALAVLKTPPRKKSKAEES
ncbi:MAG: helicase-related protein [Pseudomonadota bacterium]